MTRSLLDTVTFPWVVWILLLLIPITAVAFYPGYLSRLDGPLPGAIHIHFVAMLGWLALAIAQPFLIRSNRIAMHKSLGRLSYLLMPLIIATGYLILRYSYRRALGGDDVGPPGFYPDDLPLHIKAAEFVVIGSVYWLWLILYYVLGVIYRKQTVAHATYMIAAAFTMFGPSGDRAIGHLCDAVGWRYNWIAGNAVFAFVLGFFIALGVRHARRGIALTPVLIVTGIHVTGVILYYILPYSAFWNRVTAIVY